MKHLFARILGVMLASAGTLAAATPNEVKADAATYRKSVEPLLARYCYGCHNANIKSGNLNLQAYQGAGALKDFNVWENVAQKMHAGVMPPPGMPRPKAE